jgi:hypothetical protein
MRRWNLDVYMISYKENFIIKVIACLALDPKFVGTNPAKDDEFLRVMEICSTPSFGGEVKPPVPWHRFMACKRTLQA